LLALLVAACGPRGGGPTPPEGPAGWVRIDDFRDFSFRAPPGTRSEAWEYVAGDLRIMADPTPYAPDLCSDPTLSREATVVNGRPARVATWRREEGERVGYGAGVYFPPPPGEWDALTVIVEIPTAEALPRALALLETVVWDAPPGERPPPCVRLAVVDVRSTPPVGTRCRPGGGVLRVHVRDAAGRPPRGVTVALERETAILEQDGTGVLCVDAGRHQVWLYAGDASGWAEVEIVEGGTTTITVVEQQDPAP
jgi:hypothetical protein